jgi:hypothetical protein
MRKSNLFLALPLIAAAWALTPSEAKAQKPGTPSPVHPREHEVFAKDPIPQSSKLAPLPKDTLSFSTDSLPFSKANPFSQHPQIDTLVAQWAKQSPGRDSLVHAVNKALNGQKPIGKIFVDIRHYAKPEAPLYLSYTTAEQGNGKVTEATQVTFNRDNSIMVEKVNYPMGTTTTTLFSLNDNGSVKTINSRQSREILSKRPHEIIINEQEPLINEH